MTPHEATAALIQRLAVVHRTREAIAPGRVLAEDVVADRPSPAASVSAMDGYAVRIAELRDHGKLPVTGDARAGSPPQSLGSASALRIFTGAVVPTGADTVVMRERIDELDSASMRLLVADDSIKPGEHIRYLGENGSAGDVVISRGTLLNAATIAAAANFGVATASLYRRVSVSVIVTGDELMDVTSTPEPWQIRDSNGATIRAVCDSRPWLSCRDVVRVQDDPVSLRQTISHAIHTSDAVVITGGVSKGDHDYVPAIIADLGNEIIFHRLPIRPGRPILGAVSPDGKLILGLPGNPVSTLVTMTQFGLPMLGHVSGQTGVPVVPDPVIVVGDIDATLDLHWYRLVRTTGPGQAEIIKTRGSGDLVALAKSTGYVHQPPRRSGPGPWPYVAW